MLRIWSDAWPFSSSQTRLSEYRGKRRGGKKASPFLLVSRSLHADKKDRGKEKIATRVQFDEFSSQAWNSWQVQLIGSDKKKIS